VIEVARELFGQEARKRSTVREKHFPDNSGLFVNVQKNKWFSPGDKRGGDVVSLVQFATGCDFKGTLSYLGSATSASGCNALLTMSELQRW
jgi:hypothetical protein